MCAYFVKFQAVLVSREADHQEKEQTKLLHNKYPFVSNRFKNWVQQITLEDSGFVSDI